MEEEKKSFDLRRQVFLVVGSLVFISIVLGAAASKWWLLIALGVSIGMLRAAYTGTCPLEKVLSRLPFNQGPGETS